MDKACALGMALVVLCHPRPGLADEIELKSGAVTSGIIERETAELVEVRTHLGIVGIGRELIAEIRRASPEENAALERAWAQAEAALEAERDARRTARALEQAAAEAFAAQQRAKGLVLFDAEWVTPEEAELRLRLKAQDELRTRVAELEGDIASWRERALRAEGQAETLAGQADRLETELADRDAHLAALADALADRDRQVTRLYERLTHVEHHLRRCRERCPPAP